MKETDHLYLFYRHQFGQWTMRDITDIHGVTYNCCEQYMMAQKAILFGDKETYEEILKEPSPKEQQALGRKIQGFDAERWDQHKYAIVWIGNFLKFSQHEDLKERLLKTCDKLLAEASPNDLIWGIGFGAEEARALDPDLWRGQNLLGKILMSVRGALNIH